MSDAKAMHRLTELLADEAVTGLDEARAAEIDTLMGAGTGLARDDFMKVAGLVQAGFLHQDNSAQQKMPPALRAKLEQQAKDFFDQGPARNDPAPVSDLSAARRARAEQRQASPRLFSTQMTGWYLAAALALVFVVVGRGPAPDSATGEGVELATLLAEADVIVAPWVAEAAGEGYEQVTGDVVWSNERQTGYMRLSGLVANNPENAQYQLWIVDPERDERPVDGGVFDVPAGEGEVIIPIDPKLRIKSPAAFAITLEQPGGVVVSGGPLLVVAPVAG